MRTISAGLFALILAAPAAASSGGPAGRARDLLEENGYVTLDAPEGPRVAPGKRKDIELLSRLAPAALEMTTAAVRFAEGGLAADPGTELSFEELSSLPADGAMTPTLHALLLLLAASHESARALSVSGRSLSVKGATLFETPWGRRFVSATRADALEDPRPAVKPFFDAFIGGPRPGAEAKKHLLDFLAKAYQKDAEDLLRDDARRGEMSAELRLWLAKYLADQRRLFDLRRNRRRLKRLNWGGRLLRELNDLETIASALADDPGLAERLPPALADPPPSPPSAPGDSVGLRLRLARADTLAQACDLSSARAAYIELEAALSGSGPTPRGLRGSIRARLRRVEKNLRDVDRLKSLVSEVRDDISTRNCRYDAARADDALRLARSLPPGCGGWAETFAALRAKLLRRRDDKRYFRKAVKRGRSQRRACLLGAAAETWSGALAVLDADPEARCGELSREADELEGDLAGLKGEEARFSALSSGMETARDDEDKASALAMLRERRAAASAMPSSACVKRELSRAVEMTHSIGLSLEAPSFAAAAKAMPDDPGLKLTLAAVAAEAAKIESAEAARRRLAEEIEAPALPPVERAGR